VIGNPGFETQLTALQPGIAASWAITTVGTAEQTADFAGDAGALATGYETFDHGWGDINPQALLTVLPVAESYGPDSMSDWFLNQPLMFLAVTEAATFESHTTAFEIFSTWEAVNFSFESSELQSVAADVFDWEAIVTTLSSVEAARFGTSDGAREGATVEIFEFKARQAMRVDLDRQRLVRQDGWNFEGELNDRVQIETGGVLPEALTENVYYEVLGYGEDSVELSAVPGSNESIHYDDIGVGIQYIIADAGRYWPESIP
jgi:hypothetical protein